MIDPEDNPEIKAAEASGELATPVIGGPEMGTEALQEIQDDLKKLPYELSDVFERIAPGLRGVVFERSRELSAKLLFQLNNASERVPYGDESTFDANNADISETLESLNFSEINDLVMALKQLAAQLEDRVQGQSDNRIEVDMDELSAGEPRAVQQFWKILTGEAEIGDGHKVEVGAYVISAKQSQGEKGVGVESRKLVIEKNQNIGDDYALAA